MCEERRPEGGYWVTQKDTAWGVEWIAVCLVVESGVGCKCEVVVVVVVQVQLAGTNLSNHPLEMELGQGAWANGKRVSQLGLTELTTRTGCHLKSSLPQRNICTP